MNRDSNFTGFTMDEIVFENRNKDYGAFALRGSYQKILLKALTLSIGLFVFGLFTPKIANSLGLFAADDNEKLDTIVVTILPPPPSSKPDEPPPPPPPPVEEVQRPTAKFLEMEATREHVEDPPPTVEELKDKDPGFKDQKGDPDANPVIIDIVDNSGIGDDKIYTEVDQPPTFIGGEDAFQEFLMENLVYPEEEKRLENTGVSVVVFVVDKEGKVEDVKISKSSGFIRFDNEAARVIKLCKNRFKAGRNNGKAVKSVCKIPITFELEEEY